LQILFVAPRKYAITREHGQDKIEISEYLDRSRTASKMQDSGGATGSAAAGGRGRITRERTQEREMSDTRQGNTNWQINPSSDGSYSYNAAHLAVLMDLRDELRSLNFMLSSINCILNCRNFKQIPSKIEAIRKNTDRNGATKRKKKSERTKNGRT